MSTNGIKQYNAHTINNNPLFCGSAKNCFKAISTKVPYLALGIYAVQYFTRTCLNAELEMFSHVSSSWQMSSNYFLPLKHFLYFALQFYRAVPRIPSFDQTKWITLNDVNL